MKILKITSIIITVLVSLLVIVYLYYGGFRTIKFTEEEQGGETLVYEEMIGDYGQSPIVQMKIYEALLNEKIETTKGFGIYYDNPKKVERSEMRSDVGCIAEGLDSTAIAQLAEKYNVKILPKSKCIVTEFPNKGMLSIFIGIIKVYPALETYCKRNGLEDNSPIMEIYDVPNKKIIYRKFIVWPQ